MFINDIQEGQIISIDSEIKIPLNPTHLNTPLSQDSDQWIPVVYKVKKGETLYSISNSYFPQRMDHLIHRNNIQSFFIKNEQELIVGWWDAAATSTPVVEAATEIKAEPSSSTTVDDIIEDNPVDLSPNKELTTTSVTTIQNQTKVEEKVNVVQDESEDIVEDITENEKKVLDIISQIMEERRIEEEGPDPTYVDESNGAATQTEAPPAIEADKKDLPILEMSRANLLREKVEILEREETTLSELGEIKNPEPELKTFSKKGIGLWDKNDPDATNLFVMHRTAKINSLVKLYNPVTKQTVTARVIGHIIDKLYPPDVDIIVTKGVAQKLGARDSRFRIEMNYYE